MPTFAAGSRSVAMSHERVIQTLLQCVERQEVGLSTSCGDGTDLLQHAAALRTIPQCRVFHTIAQRCEEKYGPDADGTLIKNETYFACMKHPPIEWLEEAKDHLSPQD